MSDPLVLQRLRLAELQLAHSYLPHGGKLLEVGGGSGYQASLLAAKGYEVTSVDIATAPTPTDFPVVIYDGVHLPFAAKTFDIVFSSNVLEHVPRGTLVSLLRETLRVLKPSGHALHLLPTPAWRLWTSLAYYPWAARQLLLQGAPASALGEGKPARSLGSRLGFPLRAHGAYSSALAELYYFRRKRWQQLFAMVGFSVRWADPTGLFYTGNALLPSLSVSRRHHLAGYLGSACHLYLLRPTW